MTRPMYWGETDDERPVRAEEELKKPEGVREAFQLLQGFRKSRSRSSGVEVSKMVEFNKFFPNGQPKPDFKASGIVVAVVAIVIIAWSEPARTRRRSSEALREVTGTEGVSLVVEAPRSQTIQFLRISRTFLNVFEKTLESLFAIADIENRVAVVADLEAAETATVSTEGKENGRAAQNRSSSRCELL